MANKSNSVETITLTPKICVFCGKSFTKFKELDAREERTHYFVLGRVEASRYGAIYQVPYCEEHFADAEYILKKFHFYHVINNIANAIVLISTLVLAVIFIPSDLTNCIVLKLFYGLLIAGGILLPFTPIFSLITGIFFPKTLDKERRKDFLLHLKAQKYGNPFMGNLIYLPGISIDYLIPHGKNIPINKTILVTNPSFAKNAQLLSIGEVLLERERRKKTIKKTPENLVRFCCFYKFFVEIKKHPDYKTLICDKSMEDSSNKNPCTQYCLRSQNYIHQLETIFWKQELSEESILRYERLFNFFDYTSL